MDTPCFLLRSDSGYDCRRLSEILGEAVIGVSLHPGDLILWLGTAGIHRTVQKLTHARWSQVGLVIYLTKYDRPLLFEATSTPLSADIETGTFATGVRTTPLESRLACFEGMAAVRKLRHPFDGLLSEKLEAFRHSVINRPFNFSLLDSRRSLRRSHQEWDDTSFVCSSLVAAAYQWVGVMKRAPQGPLPNNVLPGDFSEDNRLPLEEGCSFDQEIILKAS